MTRKPSRKWPKLQKPVAVMGGFMILIGVVLFGIAVLSYSGLLDVSLMLQQKYIMIFAMLMLLAGIFDAIAAMIIARW